MSTRSALYLSCLQWSSTKPSEQGLRNNRAVTNSETSPILMLGPYLPNGAWGPRCAVPDPYRAKFGLSALSGVMHTTV